MQILIENATIVTMNPKREIINGDVLIENDKIKEIGKIKSKPKNRFNADGLTLIPGLIQVHVHLCQVLFRNLADDLELLDWLKQKIWIFESKHTEKSLQISAELGIAELIKGGTTTILDMGTVNHTDAIFQVLETSGIRAYSGKTMMDSCPDAPKKLQETKKWSVDESVRLLKDWNGKAQGRLNYTFCPRFVLSCSEDLLREVVNLSKKYKTLIHTHASENKDEVELVKKTKGKDNILFFDSIGLSGENVCLAHCVHATDEEIKILALTKTSVLHCPSANLKLGSGIARIPEMLEEKINIGLGADGAPCNNNLDMFQEMRLASLIQKQRLGAKAMPAEKVFEMATIRGAKALHSESQIGSIEIGKKADLVFLDLNKIHSTPVESVYSQIVYSAKSSDVESVMIDGKWIMKKRKLLTLDEESILQRAGKEIKNIL
jgi:5-methylthioadenosine/S-adenosylhomocysteine deaminase